MQKSVFKIYTLLFVLCLSFSACQKEESLIDTTTENTTAEQDLATAANLYQDTEEEVDAQIEAKIAGTTSSDCPTVTFAQPKGTYPNTITIDYGTVGCEGPKGRIRTGQIIVEQNAPLTEAGATRNIQPNNFTIDGVLLEGERIWSNNGLNSLGQQTWTRSVEAQLFFPNGNEAGWKANHDLVLIEGSDSPIRLDDVWSISGSSTGVNRNGVAFDAQILAPLIKRRTCAWVESGERSVSANGKTRTLDYGTGSCDPFANLELANGNSKQILLKKWW